MYKLRLTQTYGSLVAQTFFDRPKGSTGRELTDADRATAEDVGTVSAYQKGYAQLALIDPAHRFEIDFEHIIL